MRFDGLDLNLLVVLDALIEERNVSRTAQRLNLTQPAITGALNRLRQYFRDDLLVLHGRQMHPTPKAEALAAPVRRILLQIRGEVTRTGAFTPATAQRLFRIAASDYAYTIVLADVVAGIASVAPGISFELIPPSRLAGEMLDRAEIDLMFTVAPYVNPAYPVRELWRDRDVVISWCDAAYATIDEDTFYAAGHAVATFGPDRRPSITDEHIAALGRPRTIEVLLPNFGDLCRAVVGTRRLATMHRRYAEYFAQLYPLRLHEMWQPFPEIIEVVQWHKVRSSDPGLNWLVGQITERTAML